MDHSDVMAGTGKLDFEIVVIGAGFSGIGMGIKLLEAGFSDFLIVDEAGDVGGTWHWNTYPGIAVDIPSYSYQFSFEKRPSWSRTYAHGDELKDYARHCVEKYGLRSHIRHGVTITEAWFDEESTLWRLNTASGQELSARFVINASGVLTRPKWPDIPGVEEFGGVTMHTSRWDHEEDLVGKRVAVIGTGASAVQVIPEIAKDVRALTVFQRTPIWCLPKLDFPMPPAARTLLKYAPGGQLAARAASQMFVEATFPVAAHFHTAIPMAALIERAALRFMRSQVTDPVVRDKLTPRYALGCKRPSFHNQYLATFNRDNVHLETSPISHIDTAAVHTADGGTHEIDVLILATGFKVMESENMPTYTLRGVGGVDQAKWWDENRLQAYEGVSVPGFPNHFSIFGPYGYNGSSYFTLIEAQAGHILRCLRHARSQAANYVEVTREANDRFFTEMLGRRGRQVFWQPSCATANSYYFDKHGDVPLRPTTTVETFWRSRRFDLDDYTFEQRADEKAISPS
ncbi:monoxygenase [Mycolicibacterium doricum]|uniref:Monoxygenase n=2 Tax=Mycolicibacterium doricum TaxID=126673 RepID=A0A7I7VWU2_9MYCO|nr:NAD(P)/FAD-dependent oxidoreductase [Mycolicibacterium doricum]BBZ09784.1 monoxygenase [Mycolicibacterium doricum]